MCKSQVGRHTGKLLERPDVRADCGRAGFSCGAVTWAGAAISVRICGRRCSTTTYRHTYIHDYRNYITMELAPRVLYFPVDGV